APEPAIGPPRHTMAAPPEPPTLETLEAALDPRERRRIDDTAREMEGLFLKVVLAQLQRSMGVKGGAFGDSFQGEFYTGLAMEQMGEGMAGGREGGIGVGRVIYEQLVRATAGQTVWPD
ncbi:MAG TPA: rod-binding protein, partial [bacterium]|nr:rod-binding protein [bacterium]